jgi:hypothetical protein
VRGKFTRGKKGTKIFEQAELGEDKFNEVMLKTKEYAFSQNNLIVIKLPRSRIPAQAASVVKLSS